MTPRQAAEVVGLLIAVYRDNRVTEETSQAYERLLSDLDYDLAQRAVLAAIRTSKFFPTVAEILETAQSLARGPRRLGGEAWGQVVRATRRIGHYGVPEFQDQITQECVRLMGWKSLCLGTNDAADRARFIELYEGISERDRRAERTGVAPQLPRSGFRNLKPPAPSVAAPSPPRLPAPVRMLPERVPSKYAGKSLTAEQIESAMAAGEP